MGKKKRVKTKQMDGPDVDFETSLAELELIVSQLEQGQLGLSDSLARYEQGVKYLKRCYRLLENAEKKVSLLRGVDADGNPVTEPLEEPGANSLVDKAEARSRRRSKRAERHEAAPSNPGGVDDVDLQGGLF